MAEAPPRKYQTESVVNLHTCNVIMLPADQLHEKKAYVAPAMKKAMDRCHIYLICRRAVLSYDPSTFIYAPDRSTGHFVRRKSGQEERTPFWFRPTPPRGGRVEVAPYPHRDLLSFQENGELGEGHWPASVTAMQTNLEDRSFVDLEVLYVGQAYGQGHRSALDRLRNHETLQKVLAQTMGKSPDDEIAILMFEYAPQALHSQINGATRAEVEGEEDTKRWVDLLNNPLTERQEIGLAEAGLIRYFQPEFNEIYKANFPKLNQAVLKQCYERDLWGVTVEINTEEIFLRIWSQKRAAGYHHIASFDLHDPKERQSFYGITDEAGDFTTFDISGPTY